MPFKILTYGAEYWIAIIKVFLELMLPSIEISVAVLALIPDVAIGLSGMATWQHHYTIDWSPKNLTDLRLGFYVALDIEMIISVSRCFQEFPPNDILRHTEILERSYSNPS